MKKGFWIGLLASFAAVAMMGFVGCTGEDGKTPFIGENGNWWIGSEDTGVSAQGAKGDQGEKGDKGSQGAKGDQGEKGDKGDQGEKGANGVSVESIEKTGTQGTVDTYTITFSDGNKTTFTVTNGKDGKDITISSVEKTGTTGKVDSYRIVFSDQTVFDFTVTNGNDGESVTISSIVKTGSIDLIDTYEIRLSDGSKKYFTVTNGRNGETPFIGENGNWWIGTEDTGVLADPSADERRFSDGLYFRTTTVNGKAGLVVSSYNGADKDVVIPNYAGLVPVIGIESGAFKGNTSVTSVSLSKNTVWLDGGVFESCTKLSSVDFNGCKLTEIPDRAFYETALTEVELPSTVKTLGDSAFKNVPLIEINYENVTSFGDYSLNGFVIDCVYLTEAVESVGSYAFASTYVYAEHEEAPQQWESDIAGSNDLNKVVTYNCKKNEEYIYRVTDNGVSVHFYIGDSKKISVPSTIEEKNVTEIGYGFHSLTKSGVDYLYDIGAINNSKPASLKLLQVLEEVKLPNTVKRIEYGAFVCYGTMIFIPSSVETVWAGIGRISDELSTSFLAFEGTTYPTFKNGFLATATAYTNAEWLSKYGDETREALGILPARTTRNDEADCYYYQEVIGYSLLAVMDLESVSLTIASKYGEGTVHTIRPDAVSGLNQVQFITLSDGIQKVQAKAFDNLSLSYVSIADSVATINAYGFDSVCSKFFVEADEKPSEWDTYWAGSSTSSCAVTWSMDFSLTVLVGDFMYEANENETELAIVAYLGSSTTIKIPRSLVGLTVTTIKSGAFKMDRNIQYSIYVPETVTKVESKAFVVNSRYYNTYFYLETASVPTAWATDYYYNTYYASTTSYKSIYYSQTLDY